MGKLSEYARKAGQKNNYSNQSSRYGEKRRDTDIYRCIQKRI